MKRRCLHIWIACLAILLNALAPSVSHALAAAANDGRGEICSTYGAASVATPRKSAPDSLLHHLEHCPFCGSHAGNFALPAAPSSGLAVLAGHDLYPALFYGAPGTVFSWIAALPRGPPVLS